MDLGPLFDHLFTVKNLITMIACGTLIEVFKRGPYLKKFAETKWGKAGVYYAPFLWGILAQVLPVGLAPADATIGHKVLLGIILGGATSKAFDLFVKGPKHLLRPAA